MKPLRVVIAGGGTGGHLFPGLAVARELLRRRPDAVVTFAGTARGDEARVIPGRGVLAAAVRRIPTLLMEQNAVPGLTTRTLARVVSAAAVTFDETIAYFGR